jgi:hypothetical protein
MSKSACVPVFTPGSRNPVTEPEKHYIVTYHAAASDLCGVTHLMVSTTLHAPCQSSRPSCTAAMSAAQTYAYLHALTC